MKNFKLLYAVLVMLSVAFFSCEKQEVVNAPDQKPVNEKEKAVMSIIDLLNEPGSQEAIVNQLKENKPGVNLTEILSKVQSQSKAFSQLSDYSSNLAKQTREGVDNGYVEVPELWLHQPQASFKSTDILVTYVPEGDEKNWKQIVAYNLNKEEVMLDVVAEPVVPVIVLETNGSEALKVKVEYMNKVLKAAGLQKGDYTNIKPTLKNTSGLETTVIERVSLRDDKEPWIKGAAEVYAVTSGIRDANGKKEPEIAIVDMPYLDHQGKDYYPNQVVLVWNEYYYQAANIQFFEQDSRYNYKQLVDILVSGVIQIVGIITEQPWLPALGKIASAVIQAMPDEWYTDNDDYVDSYYTIMKNQTYTNHNGAAGNASITLKPLYIPAN